MKRFAVILVSLFASIALTYGAGFAILEQSVGGMGRGLAGMTAAKDDPSALYFNPAGAAWVERPTIHIGTHVLTGNVRFHDEESTLAGQKSGDIIGTSFIPNIDLTLPVGDGLNLSLAMTATSGTSTKFNHYWMGRYFGYETDIKMLEVQPSVSYRISDELAVGFGFMAQSADVVMKQAINTAAYGNDSRIHMEGDCWSYGYALGVVYAPFEGTSFGLGYRSKMTHDADLKGKVKRLPAALQAGLGLPHNFYRDEATLRLKMPQNVNFGVQQIVTDQLTLMADVCWTDWGSMDEMTLKFKKGTITGKKATEQMDWHYSWRFSIGGDYRLDERWTLRAGFTFDERPVTNHATKTCKLPDSNRYWTSVGFSYQWTSALRLDCAFTHLFFQPSGIEQTDPVSHQKIKGKFTGYTNLLSLGLRYEF